MIGFARVSLLLLLVLLRYGRLLLVGLPLLGLSHLSGFSGLPGCISACLCMGGQQYAVYNGFIPNCNGQSSNGQTSDDLLAFL